MIRLDIPMPEACDVCPFNYDFCCCNAMDDDTWNKWDDDWNNNVCERTDRPDYCPLKAEHDMPCCNCPMNPIRPVCRDNKVYCGQCGKRIPLKIKANYCHKCGREINWLP